MNPAYMRLLALTGAVSSLPWSSEALSAASCSVDTFQSFLDANKILATVQTATSVASNGTFTVPADEEAYTTSPTGLRALCAIQVNETSEAGTHYTFGLFLPEDWNGRYLTVGNGGYAGGINWIDMGAGVGYGFAVMSTDTGHRGNYQATSWAYGNPESITDWGWRAMHGSTVTSKVLIEAWYGTSPKYNYFSGCSVGGRQGLKALQMFPEDYDGVSVGAPAWWTTHLQLDAVKTLTYNQPAGAKHAITKTMFNIIGAEVLRQCDPQDGLTDTIISDPSSCRFDPTQLLCNGKANTDCLIGEQIQTLYKIYNDWVETNQTFVFPHYLLGTEGQWSQSIGDGSSSSLENQYGYAQDLLMLGPSWTWEDLSLATVQLSDAMNPGNATADEFDISPFHSRGGKLIHHHGLSDAPLPLEVASTIRHCMSTPSNVNAPWYIAGANQAAQLGASVSGVPGYHDAAHDVILALVAWVENGTAPNSIIATEYTNDNVASGVMRQRPICPHPQQAKFDGVGNPNDADSWHCALLY
ncbi:tannase and feruloyl esterase [Colletotrichum kahawae]|uniref:Carboxylic ester hydrolase n=1 Tax=Colletotrichum kahawae TaxID=34407 RepID=A0AAD9YGH0_COLKA|nr:tannase and feruloyl esterase [Colletotrichum kahawae]